MATKTTAEKLLIKPGATIWASDAAHRDRIGTLPPDASYTDTPAEAAIALIFAGDESSLRDTLVANKDHLASPATLWVAYPKANRTDINRDTLWPILTEYGMRPIGQVAVDDVWSALRFRPTREGEVPFTGGKK